ncbi:hypothetical protein IX39_20150 [Chryseobacterium formosense]|uniref:Uncharacterized protein n=1 Tax=Chryseobacterium formosense TaxID=236814 RepID=A0A085YYQ4_9FLAO|nr:MULTISPECIES: hypothetical protein [Chryseobacterium]KFE97317.1 hypothetical protein IX39_20150 [Chryseobacterium formosense]OCK51109.1 hypothetical protein BA768_18270 [Chryseobacterium sp. CBo1]SFT90663.1 hypothetical protein SAMN05421857_4043 [Chryseobacterium formosense]
MEKKYEFRQFSILVWAITLLVFFIGLIAFISTDFIYRIFSSTTQQTYILIFALSIALFIIVGINLYFSKIISISVKEDSIVVSNTKANTNIILSKNSIINYNLNITRKGMLDILRIKLADKNLYFWLGDVSLNQENRSDASNKENLQHQLKILLPSKNVKTSMDNMILFFANKFPFIVLFVALVILICGFFYIINL